RIPRSWDHSKTRLFDNRSLTVLRMCGRSATEGQEVPMRHFSVRPPITLEGRKFKGLRGYAGKPFHPPLTDFPIVAYLIGAALDVLSVIGGDGHTWSREMWPAGTFIIIGGAAVSVLAAVTGFVDWLRSSEPGTQARRTANTHAVIMLTVTVLTLVNIAL